MTMAEAPHEVQSDRRGSRRYRSPDGIFVVENAAGSQPIGELLDISANGLSFIYSAEIDALRESERLNVVSASGEVHLEQIPYQNMNDFDYIRNYPFDAYRLRRRGVSFTGLSETQEKSLAMFLQAVTRE